MNPTCNLLDSEIHRSLSSLHWFCAKSPCSLVGVKPKINVSYIELKLSCLVRTTGRQNALHWSSQIPLVYTLLPLLLLYTAKIPNIIYYQLRYHDIDLLLIYSLCCILLHLKLASNWWSTCWDTCCRWWPKASISKWQTFPWVGWCLCLSESWSHQQWTLFFVWVASFYWCDSFLSSFFFLFFFETKGRAGRHMHLEGRGGERSPSSVSHCHVKELVQLLL